ncbi:MAG: site-specific DNA-methyltransferase [Candidatus Omnitrophota bacterium]
MEKIIELNQVICGDALTVLKSMPSDLVDCVITSPPYYSLRDYQIEGQIGLEPTFEDYINNLIQVFAEVKRVLKPTGAFWLNMGDAYASSGNSKFDKNKYGAKEGLHCGRARMKNYPDKCMLMMPERIAIKCIDELGFTLRNKCHWVKQILDIKNNRTYGSVMPTSVDDRLNEAGEVFYFFTKNKRYYSNLDAVRIPHQYEGITDFRPPGLLRRKMYANSKYNQFDFRPDGSTESKMSVQEEEKLTSYIARKHGYDPEGICPVCNRTWKRHASPNASNRKAGLKREFILCITQAKYLSLNSLEAENYNSPRAREVRQRNDKRAVESQQQGLHTFYRHSQRGEKFENPIGKNIPTYWLLNPQPRNFRKELDIDVEHFACFPDKLVEIPIIFTSPEKGIVLDPFCGAGTTLLIAQKLNRNYLGIDINLDYCRLAQKRLSNDTLNYTLNLDF